MARKGAASVDMKLAEAFGESDPAKAEVLVRSVSEIANCLRPSRPGPVLQQFQQEQTASNKR